MAQLLEHQVIFSGPEDDIDSHAALGKRFGSGESPQSEESIYPAQRGIRVIATQGGWRMNGIRILPLRISFLMFIRTCNVPQFGGDTMDEFKSGLRNYRHPCRHCDG